MSYVTETIHPQVTVAYTIVIFMGFRAELECNCRLILFGSITVACVYVIRSVQNRKIAKIFLHDPPQRSCRVQAVFDVDRCISRYCTEKKKKKPPRGSVFRVLFLRRVV